MKRFFSIAVFVIIFTLLLSNIAFAADEDLQSIKNDVYSMNLPDWGKVLSTSATDYTTILSDKELDFTAKIWFEKISDEDLSSVRDYLGDYTSDNKTIYNKIIDLKASSYDAVEKSYKNSSLFYPLDKDYSEYDFKIIDKQDQELFGVRSFGIMYNTLDASLNNVSEFSRTDIFIPSPVNGGIFNINITIPRDNLNIDLILRIAQMINSIELKGHTVEDKVPVVFIANSNMQKSAAGIYPAFTFKNYNLKSFYRKDMGLSFLYPDFLIPTDELTSFTGIKTASFKIDPFTTFNVNVSDSKFFSRDDAIASVFASSDKNTKMQSNILESPNGNIFEIRQNYSKNDINYKKYTYILSQNDRTVTYTFTTSAQNSSYSLDNIAIRILMTTKIFEKESENTVQSFTYNETSLGDVTVDLPNDFKVEDVGGKYKKITSNSVSTFKIYLYEEELTKYIDFEAASKLAKYDYSSIKDLIRNSFYVPYTSIHSTFLGSNFDYNNDAAKIYLQSKYLDEDNRVHYCYTVSIAKDNKLYSMLLDVNSLLFKEDGKVGKTMPKVLDDIAQSFKLK